MKLKDPKGAVTTDQVFMLLFFFQSTPLTTKAILVPFMQAFKLVVGNAPAELRQTIYEDRSIQQLLIFGNALELAAQNDRRIVCSP